MHHSLDYYTNFSNPKEAVQQPVTLLKKYITAQVLLREFSETFKNTLFAKTPPSDCYWKSFFKKNNSVAKFLRFFKE